jgi:hypothetical protein
MKFYIGLENGDEQRSVAWVLGHPGCFAYGRLGYLAWEAVPTAITAYYQWIVSHGGESWLPDEPPEVILDENFDCVGINENYDLDARSYVINAWFRRDWLPLTTEDIERGLKLLEWSRADLLAVWSPLSQEVRQHNYEGERWPIDRIVQHVGGAEWWYLDRLGLAFPREQVPEDPLEKLEIVRRHLVLVLPTLEGSKQVVGKDGEIWSARKMLRRAVWHERDHTEHIRKLSKIQVEP